MSCMQNTVDVIYTAKVPNPSPFSWRSSTGYNLLSFYQWFLYPREIPDIWPIHSVFPFSGLTRLFPWTLLFSILPSVFFPLTISFGSFCFSVCWRENAEWYRKTFICTSAPVNPLYSLRTLIIIEYMMFLLWLYSVHSTVITTLFIVHVRKVICMSCFHLFTPFLILCTYFWVCKHCFLCLLHFVITAHFQCLQLSLLLNLGILFNVNY